MATPSDPGETACFFGQGCPSSEVLGRLLAGELDDRLAVEVNLHLERCDPCLHSIAGMTPPLPGILLPGFLAINQLYRPATEWLPEIAGYEIIEELGRGGMGVVFLARHLALNRNVAIKVISTGHLTDAKAVGRFKREAEVIARINDPHVVQVFDIGQLDDLPYLVMEYVQGRRLTDILRVKLPAPRDAADLVATLAGAVQRFHFQSVVHCDLKPGNILLAEPTVSAEDLSSSWLGGRTPKITDFGLARLIAADTTQAPSREIAGTPSYMAPEQVRGASNIGIPADVYGLGAILYELLTGHPPFQSPSTFDVLQQVLHREPIAPSSIRSGIPADLETICLKCLQKEPGDRISTAGEVFDELGRFLRNEPLRIRPLRIWERMFRWSKRHPAQAVSLVLALIACMATAGLATAYPFAIEQQRLVSDLQQEHRQTLRALDQADTYRRAAEEATTTLAVNQALDLCANGNSGRGLNWLARSLQLCRDNQSSPAIAIRRNLSAWAATVHQLVEIVPNRRELGKLAVSADGQTLAAGTWGCDILIWNIDASPSTAKVLNQPSAVTAVAFSKNGRWLATGGFDGSISLWDPTEGTLSVRWNAHRQQVTQIQFIDGDRRLLSSGKDGAVRSWDAGDQRPLTPELLHPAPVLSLATIKGESLLLTSCSDGRLRRWNIATGVESADALDDTGESHCVSANTEGSLYAVSKADGTVQIYSADDDRPRGAAIQHAAVVSFMAFNSDGRTISIAYMDHTARIWNWQTGLQWGSALEHADEVSGLVVSRDGNRAVTVGDDQTIRCWQLAASASAEIVSNRSELPDDLVPNWPGRQSLGMRWREFTQKVGYSPDGRIACTVAGEAIELQKTRAISLWNSITREAIGAALSHEGILTDVTFSRGNLRVATADEDGFVRIWSGVDGTPLTSPLPHNDAVSSVAFCPDGAGLVSVTASEIRLWDCESGQLSVPPWQLDGVPTIAIFDRTGDHIAVGLANGDVLLANAECPSIVRTLSGGSAGLVSNLEFSAEKSLLLVSHWGGRISAWDLTSSTPVVQADLGEEVWASAFVPDGSRFVAVTASGNVALFDLETGLRIGVPYRGSTNVNDLAVSPDNTLLANGTSKGETLLIDAQTAQPIGPAWRLDSPVHFVRFSSDARYCYVGDETRSIRRFQVPAPMQGKLHDVVRRIERYTGLSLDGDGTMHVLSSEEWRARAVSGGAD